MAILTALTRLLAPVLVLATLGLSGPARAAGEPLVVYSARKYQLVEQLFLEYGRERGIEVKSVTDDGAPLIQRLLAEGANSPADVFISVDAGDLWRAAEAGLLAPVKSQALEAAIPAHLRDPEGRWFGLAVRARTIAYSTGRVQPAELSTYAALGDAKWKGRLCLRSGKHVYNQSLVAMMIGDIGEEATERVVRSWVANLAAEPFSSDTLMLNAIAAGQCDVGVTNSYYLGRLQAEKPGFPVQIFWADQKGAGTHVNISGAGVTAHAKRRDKAVQLLEYLVSDAAQTMLAPLNVEYPIRPEIAPAPGLAALGTFKEEEIPLDALGRHQAEAARIFEEVGWR